MARNSQDVRWPTKYPLSWNLERETTTAVLNGLVPHRHDRRPRDTGIQQWLLHHPEVLIIYRGQHIELQWVRGTPAKDAWPECRWDDIPIDVRKALVYVALLTLKDL